LPIACPGGFVVVWHPLVPWGLAAFTEKPVKLFNDRFIPTARFFPERATAALSKLEQSISATNDLPYAQIQLESFLLSQITAQKSNHRLIAALKRLFETPEKYDVVSAVQDTGLSLRQFERQCTKLTGLSPKRLHKISRFNQVRMRLLAHPDSDLLDCMADAGYYDYSHFSKDFNQCLGPTPHQFKDWVNRMIARAGSENVEFLQDKP
jgi:AraC-like DNA-binding protein